MTKGSGMKHGPFRPGFAALAGVFATGVIFAGVLLGVVGQSLASKEDEESPASRRRYMMPSISLAEYVASGTDSIRIWVEDNAARVGDRGAVFEGVRDLIAQHDRFKDEVTRIYPRNQLEWMLITDAVADTLINELYPVLEAYQKAHPKEELGSGRQAVELGILTGIRVPPSRMLGFIAVILAQRTYALADSIFAYGGVEDIAGVQDGVLRNIRDWGSEYMQVHSDPMSVFQCRLVQQDWIIARLEDRCGNSGGGTWQLGQQWMAIVDTDSTVTPPVHRFAHEIHLKAVKCEGDDRVLWIDLPNFHEVQMELHRRSLELQEERRSGTR